MDTPTIVQFFAIGMMVWLVTWGSNRVYLHLKRLLS